MTIQMPSLKNAMLLLGLVQLTISGGPASAQVQPSPEHTSLPQVGQWDRFESALKNPRQYSDPFRDVELNVTYTRPDGSQVAFWGFYDGDATWRFRFMPDQVGTWKFEAAFSDGAPGASGSFECVPSDLPGTLSVYKPNPIWFAFKGEEPALPRGFHAADPFFARNWDDPFDENDGNKRTLFLDWAQAQGYNLLSVASHYLNRDAPGRGRGWNTPNLWPLNPDEYRLMETILDDLADRRILVYPFAGFLGRASNYPRDAAGQELYIKYTLARIGPYWNLLMNVAGPEPGKGVGMDGDLDLSPDEVNRLGRLIRELNVFNHPLSVHNRPGDDPYRNSSWSTYVTLQGWKNRDWARIYAGMLHNQPGDKPVYAQEVFWPGNRIGHGQFTPDEIRKKGFVLKMAAATINFADMDGHSSSGFSGSLDLADKVQERHDIIKQVWDFFETVPFHQMRPRPDLVSRSDDGLAFCLAEPGKRYLVYLISPGSLDVKVEGGPYQIEWIDARDTSVRHSAGSTPDGQGLQTPDQGEDWLLYLTGPR